MKRLIIFLLLFAAIKVAGQTTGYLRFDTVMIYKVGGTAELVLMNKTKDTLGVLTNYGNGRTRFMKSRAINDSTIVVGLDTLVIRGGGGSGSVTSITQGYGIIATPNPITSTGTIKADTTGSNGLVTRHELIDSTDITTQLESPLYVKIRSSWPVPDTLALDSTIMATRAAAIKISDSLVANRVKYTDTASMLSKYLPKDSGPLTVKGNPTNSTTAAVDIAAASDNQVLRRSGTTLGFGAVNLASTNAVTGQLPEDNLAAFSPYPAEGTGVYQTLYEQSLWSAADLGTQFQRGSNHTITLVNGFPTIASSTIVWGGNSISRFLPQYPFIASADSIVIEYRITTALASNVGFGPSFYSNNVNGANFGYTTYLAVSTSTGTPHFAKQDGTSDQTGTTFTVAQNDIIQQSIGFRDTIAYASFRNLTTGSAVSTITKTFVAGSAPYPPNTGTWAFQNFQGTYEIRRIKIMSRKITSPTLMIAFDSKGQIVASPWNKRFANLLNARYPTVLNYSGGGDQLKDLLDKRYEFFRLNPEQVLIGLGSNDLRYGNSLAVTLDRLAKVTALLDSSGTRWAVTVVPEDSTAGHVGIGLTALKNNMASTYSSNYIDLWTISSTSNVLKSIYNSGDDVHPNTEWNRIADSVIAASGFFQVQSPNRRAPYDFVGGGNYVVGRKLMGPFDVPLPRSTMLATNDTGRIVPSIMQATSNGLLVSQNLLTASLLSGSNFTVYGQLSTRGTGSGFVSEDRSTSDVYGWYPNSGLYRLIINGSDRAYINTSGLWSIGSTNSGLTFVPTFRNKMDRTLGAGSVDSRGISWADDSIGIVAPGGTHSNVFKTKIAEAVFTAGSAEVITRPATLYVERSRPSTNTTFVDPYAIWASGRIRTDSTFNAQNMDSTASATGGFVYRDNVTGNFKLTGSPGGSDGNGIYSGSGSLSGDVTVSGASHILNLGTSGSPLSSFSINTSGNLGVSAPSGNIFLEGGILMNFQVFTDADGSLSNGRNGAILPAITSNRTFTFPSTGTNKILYIINENSSGNTWNTNINYQDKDGSTLSSFANTTNYMLRYTGSVWKIILKY